jgi:hypothetical protein
MCDEKAPENELIGYLEIRFAEFTNGDRPEREMMELLTMELRQSQIESAEVIRS